MSKPERNRKKNQNQHITDIEDKTTESVPITTNSILAVFVKANKHLTSRQDRHERLVKLCRDVTIESKRIIFLLHTAITEQQTKEDLIKEAKSRLGTLINGPIKTISLELANVPAYLHTRAVTAGLQEFIEARTLCSVMENRQIISYHDVCNELVYTVKSDSGEKQVTTLVPHLDYMLGLADLSGEIMRQAINGISSDDIELCRYACTFLQKLYAGFMGIHNGGAAMNNKLNTTRSNCLKVEHALFEYVIRTNETVLNHKLSLAPEISSAQPEEEGIIDPIIV